MFKKVAWLFIFICLLHLNPTSFAGREGSALFPPDSILVENIPFDSKPGTIAILGDLQRTSIWETLLGREQNDEERELILKSINLDSPSALVLLGDMVYEASNINQWKYFDRLLYPINKVNIPILPVLGNHEYYGESRIVAEEINKRFPQFTRSSWYSRTYGSTALIFLDSNVDELDNIEWQQQKFWFNRVINKYESDNNIKNILVFSHHPPYSNSLLTGDEIEVQEAFLDPFFKSKKTSAFFSGHAHTYERFLEKGKTFIISGGGGGPRVLLNVEKGCRKDQCTLPSPRPFNYLLVNETETGIIITVKALDKGKQDFYTLEVINLSKPI